MNNQIFFALYSLAHKSPIVDFLIVFFAQYFPYLVLAAAILFLLFHHEIFSTQRPFNTLVERWKEIFFVSLSVCAAWGLAIFFKFIFQIPRPFIQFENVVPLIKATNYSFPSLHSAFFMAIAIAIFLYQKKAGYWFMFSALLIGIARIMTGVHFPIDILGGYIIGALISYLLIKSYKK
jgi:undecaprenyl-diphosphatase